MSTTTTTTPLGDGPAIAVGSGGSPPGTQRRAFLAILGRDLWVTVHHEPVAFLAQALLQPLFFLFVFGRVLPEIGAAQGGYGGQLLPGIMAMTAVTVGLQNTAFPLVIDFSFTKEIEDRLLAPLPVWAVGMEKIVHASLRAIVAAALLLPLGELVLPGGLHFPGAQPLALVLVILAGAIAGASLGMLLGTAVPPHRINIMFAIVLTPLLFTGATFYPWASLDDLRWFQVVTLINPLTYVSEGSRASLGASEHLATWAIAVGVVAAIAIFGTLGLLGFRRRAVD
ncbi:ABC transporter permease [Patulibacter defluvii]|uniref:ABC transporter permease n=1 Tax=Patulibacter defluvii TaxID=3095358 RepID=UPI002A749A94|nr:ABC transporter permease [Patulibacter sp. DM4]